MQVHRLVAFDADGMPVVLAGAVGTPAATGRFGHLHRLPPTFGVRASHVEHRHSPSRLQTFRTSTVQRTFPRCLRGSQRPVTYKKSKCVHEFDTPSSTTSLLAGTRMCMTCARYAASTGQKWAGSYSELVDAGLWAEPMETAYQLFVMTFNDPADELFPPVVRVSGLMSLPVTRLCVLAAGGHLCFYEDENTNIFELTRVIYLLHILFAEEVDLLSVFCGPETRPGDLIECILQVFGLAVEHASVALDTPLKRIVADAVLEHASGSSIFELSDCGAFILQPGWADLRGLIALAGADPGPSHLDTVVEVHGTDDLQPFPNVDNHDASGVYRLVLHAPSNVRAPHLCDFLRRHPHTFITLTPNADTDLVYLLN